MPWLTWSKTQNEASAEKARLKKERETQAEAAQNEREREQQRAERARLRQEGLDELAENLATRTGATTDAVAAVRSLVEGDVFTFDEDARDESDRKAKLRFDRDRGRSRLIELEPMFQLAWKARSDRLAAGETTAALGRRRTYSKGSFWGVVTASAVLVVMEVLLQKRPMELLARHLAPELESVTAVALLGATGLVLLSTLSLLFASKLWAEYAVAVEHADAAAVDSQGSVVGEHVPQLYPWLATVAAVILQVILFYLRFQTGTTNDSTKQGIVTASALLMVASVTVALLEFQYARGKASEREAPDTRGDDIIDEYLTLHRQVYNDVPRAIDDATRRRLQAIERSLREYQRVAELKGPQLREAIQTLLAEVRSAIDQIPDREFIPPPIPESAVPSPNGSRPRPAAPPRDAWSATPEPEDVR